jgi:transposase-like protein
MARPEWRDRGKERFWRRAVRRWQRSGLGVRAFCAAEGLAEPSFYAWRRELARRDHQATTPPVFLPVHVRPDDDFKPTLDVTSPAAPAIDIVLGNGRRLRVPVGFDAGMLRQLLVIAEEAGPC